ncbi:calmodulin-binding transcription activator 1-like isoform X2 [Macadamia integrifolia]|uniref:calmodulin-binding transcription activator 1-like isoform X2 n=1 Tax=Macadamia integrifolia TaxID=60698 RepID=UPI001C500EB9|nr:calmodulin-binding transcription activator 1-like isoform X2 [Macadamia integrifolia]
MADSRRYGLGNQLDIEQILLEAQNRWLRPAEICEILRNYRNFCIAPEPPNKPPSGSLFLFDRKVLRYFRKDGHNWRKKKDGKTVKEAHERLKAGSVDVLHCYYAHGEENENFQRRSYWMLEEDFMHIVLVHYQEVKGTKSTFGRIREFEEVVPSSQMSSPASSRFLTNHTQVPSQTTDSTSLNSNQTSEFEDAESADNHQASSRYHSFFEPQKSEDRPVMNKMEAGLLDSYFPVPFPNDCQGKQLDITELDFPLAQFRDSNDAKFGSTFEPKQLDITSWEDVLEHCTVGIPVVPVQPSVSATQSAAMGVISKQENVILGQLLADECKQEILGQSQGQEKWQVASEDDSGDMSKWPMDKKFPTDLPYELSARFQEQKTHYMNFPNPLETFCTHPDLQNGHPMHNDLQNRHSMLSGAELGSYLKSNTQNNLAIEENSCTAKRSSLECAHSEEGLKKLDSFTRWMNKELGEVDGSRMQSSSGVYWSTVESGNVDDDSSMSPQVQLDSYFLSPSLSQEQLFSIIDFSPSWAFTGSETKVLITGTFLKGLQDATKCKWSCMFGEVEVPAEVLADGVLRCYAPAYITGRVPFYVTSSNRLACSEVREFEYRVKNTQDVDIPDVYSGFNNEMVLHVRLGKLLSLGSSSRRNSSSSGVAENPHMSNKISSLMKEDDDEWFHMVNLTTEEDFSPGQVKEQLLMKLLKEKLHAWLLLKAIEDGKGPSVLDNEGQGVLHLAAALGYDWAIAPTVAAGVNINFRDVNGWTALHWAAFFGRERTVVALLSLEAAPGALTDPTPKYPAGRTPADLASGNGHKGIAGYLAESSLTSHLSSLTLKDPSDGNVPGNSEINAVQTISERTATPVTAGDVPEGLSMKDSLTAVRNAAQAAARIHQVFRIQSFHRKQLIEYGDDEIGMSNERALSLITVKTHKPGLPDEPVHAAAIRIQNKFRGWKGRKEFLIIRQRIVKLQAHVRGHQVRKHFRKIIWSVGIVEKVILRWRRKGSGLRGFRSEALTEAPKSGPSKEDDYDFLKEGRKQTEERLQKALDRVKSMVQYPEARDQYRRLLTVVTEFQETKVANYSVLNSSEEAGDGDVDLIELEALLDDDTFMPTA